MRRLLGLETEYGLWIEGLGPDHMVEESRQLVRAYAGPYASPWSYGPEDPRRDMRGFSVAELSRDPDDARYDANARAYATLADEHADRILANGARLYNDHGHPEYSTPECCSLTALVAHDRAGEAIVHQCAVRRATALGRPVTVYKNNTDYHGASYGTHECYLARRDVPTDVLISSLAPFLATRQVFAGSGKVCWEGEAATAGRFQISQRADFVSVEASVDTLHRRPLVNTRDEPHAPADRYRRLHVISGDANMGQWATAMKVGTLALVLDWLEAGGRLELRLRDPVAAVRLFSRDVSLTARAPLADDRALTAIAVQRAYAQAVRAAPSDLPERDWVLNEWLRVLDDLETEPSRASDRVDWIAKRSLLQSYLDAEGLTWASPIAQSLDLAFHDVSADDGLHRGLEQNGAATTLVSEDDARRAEVEPPLETRAAIRGHFARMHGQAVRSVGWSSIVFTDHRGEEMVFDMSELVHKGLRDTNRDLLQCHDMATTIEVLRRYRAASCQAKPPERSVVP
jgi:proteasome accessory factor A